MNYLYHHPPALPVGPLVEQFLLSASWRPPELLDKSRSRSGGSQGLFRLLPELIRRLRGCDTSRLLSRQSEQLVYNLPHLVLKASEA